MLLAVVEEPGGGERPLSQTSGERFLLYSALEATKGSNDSCSSQLPYKCYLEEVASVGDRLKICPWAAFRVDIDVIEVIDDSASHCFRAKREELERFYGLSPESRGQNLD